MCTYIQLLVYLHNQVCPHKIEFHNLPHKTCPLYPSGGRCGGRTPQPRISLESPVWQPPMEPKKKKKSK